jgi:hypothetical protein
MLAVGIAAAGGEGRIEAWRGGTRNRCAGPQEKPDGSYLTCCPAHDDHNPSLVLSDRTDETGRPKLLVYCRSDCAQDDVIQALDDLGLWDCAPEIIDQLKAEAGVGETMPAPRTSKPKCEAIVPVPASAPLAPDYHPQLGPITERWLYQDADREVVFFVCRFDPNPAWTANFARAPKGVEKPEHKTFRPLSYCKFEDGSTRWDWVAPTSGIPLFLTFLLAEDPTAKVVVCEGEKAAIGAAKVLFPDRIAVAWYGGAKAVHKAPWGSLSNRDVLVWPDQDDAGSKAAQAVINELRQVGCASIAVVDAAALAAVDPRNPDGPKRQPPPKWDAADAFSEWSGDLDRLAAEVDRASRQPKARLGLEVSPDNIGETVDKAEEVLRCLGRARSMGI